jgi:hypothetical protein
LYAIMAEASVEAPGVTNISVHDSTDGKCITILQVFTTARDNNRGDDRFIFIVFAQLDVKNTNERHRQPRTPMDAKIFCRNLPCQWKECYRMIGTEPSPGLFNETEDWDL